MYYRENYYTSLGDCGRDGNISYGAILQIVETVGGHHSDQTNNNLVKSSLQGSAAIIAEWRIRIYKRTDTSEKLDVTTWVSGKPRGASMSRRVLIKDHNCKRVAAVEGKLCLIDTETKSILRVTEEMCTSYGIEDTPVFEEECGRLRPPQNYTDETVLAVRRADIDFNNHIHNTKYLEYALEAIPEKDYLDNSISEIRIVYSRPIPETDFITAKYAKTEDGHFVGIFHEDTLCAMIEMK